MGLGVSGSEGRAVAGPGADQSQPETLLLSLGERRVTGASQAMLLLHAAAAAVDAAPPAETAAAVTG